MNISFDNFTLRVGSKRLFESQKLKLSSRFKYGIVGPNGSGKTSLMRAIADRSILEECSSFKYPEFAKVRYVDQNLPDTDDPPMKFLFRETYDAIEALNVNIEKLENEYEVAESEQLELMSENIQKLYNEKDNLQASEKLRNSRNILKGLGISDEDAECKPMNAFSGGWRMKLAIACALVHSRENEFLILDEPNNHLDLRGMLWLKSYLRDDSRGVLVVSHDLSFLRNFVDHFLNVRDGAISISKEFTPNGGDSKNFVDYRIPETDESSIPLVGLNDVTIVRGDKIVLKGLNLGIGTYSKIALVGANGSGKTTLLDAIAGKLEPTSGYVRLDSHTRIAKFDQLHIEDDARTAIDIFRSAFPNAKIQDIRKQLAKFDLRNDLPTKPLSKLSGGQKTRFHLAMMSMQKPRVLLLDEPTNNLDIDSIELLKSAIKGFNGGFIIASHNLSMLDLCDVLWICKDGTITEVPNSMMTVLNIDKWL